jgi:hypothetical protein
MRCAWFVAFRSHYRATGGGGKRGLALNCSFDTTAKFSLFVKVGAFDEGDGVSGVNDFYGNYGLSM